MTSLYPRERVEATLQPLALPVVHRILLKTLSADPLNVLPAPLVFATVNLLACCMRQATSQRVLSKSWCETVSYSAINGSFPTTMWARVRGLNSIYPKRNR